MGLLAFSRGPRIVSGQLRPLAGLTEMSWVFGTAFGNGCDVGFSCHAPFFHYARP